MLGLRGSCLGIGTDIGGSIRSPAANCGVYGLRPTSVRLPMEGLTATMMGQEHVVPVIGPMSTSLGGLKVFMKTVVDSEPWTRSPGLVPIPWREGNLLRSVEGKKVLKVGVLWDDGVVRPHPPVRRALEEVVRGMRNMEGVEIVEWKPYRHDYAWSIIASLFFCDGGQEDERVLDDGAEPWRPLSKFILKENEFVKKLSVGEIWEWQFKREVYRGEYARLWGDVDVILCPVVGCSSGHDCC